MKFQVGDRVTWVSQSAGRTKRKTGTVMEVVPAGQAVGQSTYFKKLPSASAHSTRRVESYIVKTEGPTRWYWPLRDYMQPAEERKEPQESNALEVVPGGVASRFAGKTLAVNLAYIDLSDGRKVRVAARHDGPVTVTVIYPTGRVEGDPDAFKQATIAPSLTLEQWQDSLTEAYEDHMSHDDPFQNPGCDFCGT